jgi:hypothetical protein
MPSPEGFTQLKDKPNKGEELFKTKLPTYKLKCASSPLRKVFLSTLPPSTLRNFLKLFP